MGATWAIIDTDIHPRPDPARVAQFLAEPWRTRFLSGHRGPRYLGYWNPIGVRRSDAVLPDGSDIADSAQGLASYFLDVYDIEYGVLNVDDLAIGLSPGADYAAAVVSAINDVIVQEWLPVDPRLRASLIVAPTDPHLRARIWNEFIYPLVYMQSQDKYTVPLGILFLNGRYTVQWGLQMAGLAVATIIPLIVYYIFQK